MLTQQNSMQLTQVLSLTCSLLLIAATLNAQHGHSECSHAAPIQRRPNINHGPCCCRLRVSSLAEAKDAELKRLLVMNAQLRQDLASLQSPLLVSIITSAALICCLESCSICFERPYIALLAAHLLQYNIIALGWSTAMPIELSA